jgi:hypothetical protein
MSGSKAWAPHFINMQMVNFLVEKTGTGYSAYAPDFSIVATGATLDLVRQDALDGLADQCEYMSEDLAQYQLAFTLLD